MNSTNDNSKSKEEEQQPANTNLQHALETLILVTIDHGISLIDSITDVDKSLSNTRREKQDLTDSDTKLDSIKNQIDKLSKELAKVKSTKV